MEGVQFGNLMIASLLLSDDVVLFMTTMTMTFSTHWGDLQLSVKQPENGGTDCCPKQRNDGKQRELFYLLQHLQY